MPTAEYTDARQVSPDDLLAAILALAKEASGEQTLRFRGHDSELQRIFHQLVDQGESPLLSSFVYSDSGPEPYSPALTEAISRLQLAGLLGRENPDYEVILLRPSATDYFNRVLRGRFAPDEIDQIRRVAERFLHLVSQAQASAF